MVDATSPDGREREADGRRVPDGLARPSAQSAAAVVLAVVPLQHRVLPQPGPRRHPARRADATAALHLLRATAAQRPAARRRALVAAVRPVLPRRAAQGAG